MPVIFPERIRGMTSGALRQLKQDGITTACKGLITTTAVKTVLKDRPTDYFEKTEPAGQFMEAIEKTKMYLDENTDAIVRSANLLVDTAKTANKQMADVTGKVRDGTEKLGVAIDKLMKVAGRGDFAETVRLTESLVNSLERLADLEQRGMLDKVMGAMRGR